MWQLITSLWLAWLAIILGVGIIYLQRRLESMDHPLAQVHWLWGVLLGLVLWMFAVPCQGILEIKQIVPPRGQGFLDDAYAIIIIILLCVLIYKRTPDIPKPEIRIIKTDREKGQ